MSIGNSNSDTHPERFSDLGLHEVDLEIDDIDRCNKLIQENLIIENHLRQEIELKDKECNSLKFKLQELQKKCEMAERTNSSLRETLFEKQMDMENVTLEIKNQESFFKSQSSTTSVEYYVDSVSLISLTVNQLKEMEKKTIDLLNEFKTRNQLVDERMKSLTEFSDTVDLLQNEEKRLKIEVESQTTRFRYSEEVYNFESNVNLLEHEFKRYKFLKNELVELQAKKKSVDDERKELVADCQKLKQTLATLCTKYENINTHYENEVSLIEQDAGILEADVSKIFLELEEDIDKSMQQFQALELVKNNLKLELEDLTADETCLNNSVDELLSNIHDLKRKEENILKDLDERAQKRVNIENTLETLRNQQVAQQNAILNCQNTIIEVEQQISQLEFENEKLFSETESDNLEFLRSSLKELQIAMVNHSTRKACLESELKVVKVELNELLARKNLSEILFRSYEKQANAWEHVFESKKSEAALRLTKQTNEIIKQINAYRDEIENYAMESFENQLFNDALSEDLRVVEEKLIKANFDLRATGKENEDCVEQLTNLDKKLSNERTNIEMLKKLYADLVKNSIPTGQVPEYWYQSFEKMRNEYNNAIEERAKLKKRRSPCELLNSENSQAEHECESSNLLSDFDTLNLSKSTEKRKLTYNLFKQRVQKRAP